MEDRNEVRATIIVARDGDDCDKEFTEQEYKEVESVLQDSDIQKQIVELIHRKIAKHTKLSGKVRRDMAIYFDD